MEKVILKSRQVRHEESPVSRRVHALDHGGHAEIRALKENGVVRAIEVICACGDHITIDLEVAPTAGASAR